MLKSVIEFVESFLMATVRAIFDPFFWLIQVLSEGIVALIEGLSDGF